MLPDFPKLKKNLEKTFGHYLQDLIRREPLFSQIKEEILFEGNKLSTQTETGEIETSELRGFKSEFTIKREDVIAKGPKAFIESIRNSAEELSRQRAEHFFNKMKEVTDKTGNVLNAAGHPFTFDMFLEMLNKVWIDFDENGDPYMPSVVVSPEIAAKIKELLPVWQANQEYKKKFDELIERKKREWYDRESNRKLVD